MKKIRIILPMMLIAMLASTLTSCLKDKVDYQQNVTDAVKTMSGTYTGSMISSIDGGANVDTVYSIKWKVDTTGITLKGFPLKDLAYGFTSTDDPVRTALLAADTTSVEIELLLGNNNLGGQTITFFTRPRAAFSLTVDGTRRDYIVNYRSGNHGMTGGVYFMNSQSFNFSFVVTGMSEVKQNHNGTSYETVNGFFRPLRFNLISQSVIK